MVKLFVMAYYDIYMNVYIYYDRMRYNDILLYTDYFDCIHRICYRLLTVTYFTPMGHFILMQQNVFVNTWASGNVTFIWKL